MAAKLGFELVKQAMLKLLMKKGDDGIVLTLPKNEIVDYNAKITMDRLIRNGIDPDSLTSPDQVINVLDNINNQIMNKARVISADTAEGKAITEKLFGKKGEVISFKDKIENMKKSGDIVDPANLKKNDNVLTSELFQNSNLNKVALDRDRAIKAKARIKEKNSVTETVSYIKTLEPMDAMKEANSVIGRKGKYKNLTPEESKKILTDTEDHIFERDIPDEDFAKGGRAGFYTGGITDVEPSLDDIGHGSDALMARTRLMSPGAQATTSTGLNYLLAEDNDNMRVPFSAGGGGRRAFLKLMATLGGGVAAAKSGILGLGGKEVGKQTAKEVVKSAGSGTPPPYFFKLVEKIKTLGDDTIATQDKAIAKKYKDYTMEEDFAGNIQIIKKGDENLMMKDGDVYMSYKVDEVPVKGKKGSTKVEEYEEFTARPDAEGKMKDVEPGVPDEVVQEGTMFEDNMTEFGMTKKADGGRIGFNKGKLVMEGGRKFLEKVFGKEKLKNIVDNDPELEQGMLEVVEMFRNKDKEGLKMYLQKYLPHMDDAEIEDFIVSSGDSAGIEGQLIRLGSGRDYKNKIEMIEEANNIRKLKDFDVEGVSKNAEGGRIGLFLGGKLIKNQLTDGKSLLRKMLNFMAEKSTAGKKGSEILQIVNPKQLDPFLNDPRTMGKVSSEAPAGIAEIINAKKKEITEDRASMVGDIIGSARKFKKVDDDIINYKKSIINDMVGRGIDKETAAEMAENLAKMVETGAGKGSTPNITEKGLLELENIQKNLLTKDRKLQAQGGLTTMLGE